MSKVIITKAIDDSQRFCSLIQSQGLGCFCLPCIEFTKPNDDYALLDKAIRENHHYDWVFFLSKKSAEIFFTRLLELGGHFFHLSPRLKIACVGQATADFIIKEIGFPVNFIPSKFNSTTLADEFMQEFCDAKQPPGADPLEVILSRAENISDDFIDKLESGNQVKVTLVNAYKTIVPEIALTTLQNFDELLASGEELFISLTSSEIVRNFKKIIGANRLQQMSETDKLHLISIGPQTSLTIKQELPELEAHIHQASQATAEAMLDLIIKMRHKAATCL